MAADPKCPPTLPRGNHEYCDGLAILADGFHYRDSTVPTVLRSLSSGMMGSRPAGSRSTSASNVPIDGAALLLGCVSLTPGLSRQSRPFVVTYPARDHLALPITLVAVASSAWTGAALRRAFDLIQPLELNWRDRRPTRISVRKRAEQPGRGSIGNCSIFSTIHPYCNRGA